LNSVESYLPTFHDGASRLELVGHLDPCGAHGQQTARADARRELAGDAGAASHPPSRNFFLVPHAPLPLPPTHVPLSRIQHLIYFMVRADFLCGRDLTRRK